MIDHEREMATDWVKFLGGTIALGIGIAACAWVIQKIFGLKEAWTLWESLVVALLAGKLFIGMVGTDLVLEELRRARRRLADIEKRLEDLDRKTDRSTDAAVSIDRRLERRGW